MTRVSRYAMTGLLTLGNMAVLAQKPSDKPAEVAGPVQLAEQPDVVRGHVEAFPKVLPGPAVTPAVAAKINAALLRADTRVKDAALDCRNSFRESQSKDDPEAWQRSVEVTMRGPQFVAFLATDSYYCGGPYPNDGIQMPLVYDLATGSPVNWLKLLPPDVTATPGNSADGTVTGAVDWPAVTRMAKIQADSECKDAYDEHPEFALNVDARTGSVIATPSYFPHVIQACADSVELDGDALRKLHVAPRLIEALRAAQALQATTKK